MFKQRKNKLSEMRKNNIYDKLIKIFFIIFVKIIWLYEKNNKKMI